MRIPPTITTYNPVDSIISPTSWYNASTGNNSNGPSVVYIFERGTIIALSQFSGDAVTHQVMIHATANAEL